MVPAPYALGVFRRPGAVTAEGRDGDGEFTGLVVGDLVRDVSGFGTMNDLLDHWDCAQSRLDDLAASVPSGDHASGAESGDDNGPWIPLARLDVRCPVNPGQILQCGANYRRHVVDLVMAERRADESMTGRGSRVPDAEVRAWAESMMDERARSGAPYVFAGLSGNGMHWGVFLAAGDLLEGEITGLGTQRNRCVSEHGSREPAQPADPAEPAEPAYMARPAPPAKQPRQRRSRLATPREATR